MNPTNKSISVQLMGLTNQLRRNADAITARYGGAKFTGMQSFIIAYLHNQELKGNDVYQRDIEREFYISRSTVSGILTLMEKNGLIYRLSVSEDARLRRLVMTDEARGITESIKHDLDEMNDAIEGSLSPEETETMNHLLGKLWQGLQATSRAHGLETKNFPSAPQEE